MIRSDMDSLNIGLDSWIIQDGNYPDFVTGQKTQFALEFYPHSLNMSESKTPSVTHLKASRYQVCAQVAYVGDRVWVLDMGFLAYQHTQPPEYARKGRWVEGEVYIGIDPFMYFENLKNLRGMPDLTYNFRVEQILLETTPWLKEQEIFVRDEQNESYKEIAETDAWNDDGGHAGYILKCVFIDGRVS